jgi:hypothetical protein
VQPQGCPLSAGAEAPSPVWGIFAHTERLSVIGCSAPIPAARGPRDGTAKVDPLEGRAARLGTSAGSTGVLTACADAVRDLPLPKTPE